MASSSRIQCVSALLAFSAPLTELKARLSEYPWDYSESGVPLTKGALAEILRRYVAGDLTEEDVEGWAEAIEMRDDVEYDVELLEGKVLHELANPILEGELSPKRALELLGLLTSNDSNA